MPNCIKCNSTEELSIKYRLRNGTPKYICRPCRRTDYHDLHATKSNYTWYLEREELRRIKWVIEWDMKAWKINGAIMRKYI